MICFSGIGLALASAPKAVEVTIYNNDFGLVKEVRSVRLASGRQQIRIEDVPSAIDPSSVGIKSLTVSMPIQMLEQNYQYDLISPEKILEKSIGKRVKFTQILNNGQAAVIEGELLAAGNIVVKTDDGKIVLNPPGTIEVLEMPEGLISKPTLMWELETQNEGACDLELAYLTNAITWSADYVLTLNADDTKADLNGWVTINNRCGAAFNDAVLKLVAGDVHRVERPGGPPMESGALKDKMDEKKLGFAEQQLFEYHLYTLQRPATIRNNEIKQIALLSASGVSVKKQLIFEGQGGLWRSYGAGFRPGEGYATDPNSKVNVVVELQNSEKNKLGMPLPKGRIRVYKRDGSGQVQMIGEDEIDHTRAKKKSDFMLETLSISWVSASAPHSEKSRRERFPKRSKFRCGIERTPPKPFASSSTDGRSGQF